jgi:hypothetical protein
MPLIVGCAGNNGAQERVTVGKIYIDAASDYKREYALFEELDLAGLFIIAETSDGDLRVAVTAEMVGGFDGTQIGYTLVYIDYLGCRTSYSVYVGIVTARYFDEDGQTELVGLRTKHYFDSLLLGPDDPQKTGFVGYWRLAGTEGAFHFPAEIQSDMDFYAYFERLTYEITVTAGDGGTATGGGEYAYGDKPTLYAEADAGYLFDGWYIDGEKIDADTYAVHEPAAIEAVFTRIVYTVTWLNGNEEGGALSSEKTEYYYGEQPEFTVTPAEHYVLDRWEVNGTIFTPGDFESAFTVTEDAAITAWFAPRGYIVTVSSSDGTMGAVSGGGVYYFGETAGLAAEPAEGCVFDGWYYDDGADVLPDEDGRYLVDGDVLIVGRFVVKQCVLTVEIKLASGGAESDTVADVKHDKTYPYGSALDNITVTLYNGYRIVGWSVGGAPIEDIAGFVIKDDTVLVLEIERITTATVTVIYRLWPVDMEQTDSVECAYGSPIRFEDPYVEGYIFIGWYFIDDVKIDTVTFILTEDITIIAIFLPESFG